MEFYKIIKKYKEYEPDMIVVYSFVHWWKTVVISNCREKTKYLLPKLNKIELLNKEFFQELTMQELNKIKPHLTKKVKIDYNISFNDNLINSMPEYCCKKCGENTFGVALKLDKKHNIIGKCYVCKEEKTLLYNTIYFKTDIFSISKKPAQ